MSILKQDSVIVFVRRLFIKLHNGRFVLNVDGKHLFLRHGHNTSVIKIIILQQCLAEKIWGTSSQIIPRDMYAYLNNKQKLLHGPPRCMKKSFDIRPRLLP